MSITQITEREAALQQSFDRVVNSAQAALETSCKAIEERDSLRADAERYRWLFGARTAEQCASENVGLDHPLAQDLVLADLSGFYSHKELVDDMIDTAMQGETK